ncbi:hypothetical protein WL51_06970 [Burkholderia ubonensis]|uniref:Mor transcription activator family protein n=1 Tax=Burkholderia ubonensis TaxID=101571 RepID=UPI00075A6E2B|nr:Mor transcription activator family protein [Burkholderia ubonensis]KWC40824.1 hypothetical protein WL51_06970 [Burkholderia ubonensis]
MSQQVRDEMTGTRKGRPFKSKGPEVLAHMADILTTQLAKDGIAERRANEIALDVIDVMRFEFGGQNIYFPFGQQNSDEKAEELYTKFMEGSTVQELTVEYGHSIQWVYKLIALARGNRKRERDQQRAQDRAAKRSGAVS